MGFNMGILIDILIAGIILVNGWTHGSTPPPTYDTDAQAIMTAITTAGGSLTTPQEVAINDFVVDMKADGIWTKCHAIYGFVGGTAAAHAINWKSPGTYNITWNGTVTHSSAGIQGNGTNGYGNTNYNPNTHGLNFTSYHVSARGGGTGTSWSGSGECLIRSVGSFGNAIFIQALNSTVYNYVCRSSPPATLNITSANKGDTYLLTRTGASAAASYRNGSQVGTTTFANSGTSGYADFTIIGTPSSGYYSNNPYEFFSIGAGLNSTEAGNFYTRVNQLQTDLGR